MAISATAASSSQRRSALSKHADISVEAVSPLYLTPPWGKIDQPAFLNAAIRIDTTLSPRALLQVILGIERKLGRERIERWGPRRIDIDILLFGAVETDEPGLHLPHPKLQERAFALVPLVDVMPAAEFAGRRADSWLRDMDTGGIMRLAAGDWYKLA